MFRFCLGMMISASSSSGLSTVLRGPIQNSASGTSRRPPGPAIEAMASSATSVGPLSIDGTPVTRLPPSVPRLRVCTAPMVCAASTSAGNMSRISGERMICVCVTSAPMLRPFVGDSNVLQVVGARDVHDHVGAVRWRGKLQIGHQVGAAGDDPDFGGWRNAAPTAPQRGWNPWR